LYKPIKSGRLYEQIVEQIEQQILSGNIRFGDRLPSERELGEQFGVSRTAVREAMKALVQRGLIEVRPGRGTFVTAGTSMAVRTSLGFMIRIENLEGTRNLVEVREILEPEIASLAAQRATGDNKKAMQEAIDVMDANLDDADAFIEADLDFHLALAEGTQNTLILILIDTLVDVLRELRIRTSLVEGGLNRAQHHHKQILEAVMLGDPNQARKRMQLHLQQVREDSESSFDLFPEDS
jgi:GntR family transcriptional repressor for pyruvate dehydrogenase complex